MKLPLVPKMLQTDHSLSTKEPTWPQSEGICEDEEECKFLHDLLEKCCDIDIIHNDYGKEVEHCLRYHIDHREICINGKQCTSRYKQNLMVADKEQTVTQHVELHQLYYHGIAMQSVHQLNLVNKPDGIGYAQSMSEDESVKKGRLEFGSHFIVDNKSKASFDDLKDEILNNEYHGLKAAEWNELLRKCILFAKAREAKIIGLNMKEIVSLKLYTDFDQLQCEFRLCFTQRDEVKREKRQKQ